ncbi:MAG TPA: diguanylate cyclase, partial [Fimbriimonas sp.]|nr:diguanylate cyclase [Fimbriimonas sp.]
MCHWVGEPEPMFFSFLEAEGYEVQVAPLSEFTSFAKEGFQLYVIRSEAAPTKQLTALLTSGLRIGHSVIVWTKPENEIAWFKSNVEAVLTGPAGEATQLRLATALKLHADRTSWRETEERLIRINDDMQTSLESLELASRRFEALFSGLPVGCFTFDTRGNIHEWNSMATQILGIEGYEVFLSPVWSALDPEEKGFWTPEKIEQVVANNKNIEFDWSYERPDGKEVHLACKVVGLTNKKGEIVAAVAGNLDITERVLAERALEQQMRENRNYLKVMERQRIKLQEANRKFKKLAVTDGLTGITNRRKFNEMLDETLDRAMRQNGKFSLLLFDIDNFKALNDTYGHHAGDEVLQLFAEVLQATARRYERPARFGGEEFAIILDNCDRVSAILAAERFMEA